MGEGLQVEQDLAFERREWQVERVGWIVMLLVVLAAIAGLLGPSPLTRTLTTSPDGALSVRHYRVARAEAPSELTIFLAPSTVKDGAVRLWINRELITAADIEAIVPEPVASELAGDRTVLTFAAREGGDMVVRINYTPTEYWRLPVRVGLDGGQEIAFDQFIWP